MHHKGPYVFLESDYVDDSMCVFLEGDYDDDGFGVFDGEDIVKKPQKVIGVEGSENNG